MFIKNNYDFTIFVIFDTLKFETILIIFKCIETSTKFDYSSNVRMIASNSRMILTGIITILVDNFKPKIDQLLEFEAKTKYVLLI